MPAPPGKDTADSPTALLKVDEMRDTRRRNAQNMKTRFFLIFLIVLNCLVLLGQLWPEGAPPSARMVNIFFLIGSLAYFVIQLKRPSN